MDDLYRNAWGDPLNDYSNQPYPLPTWNTQPSPPAPSSPIEDDQNDNHVNDDKSECTVSTGTQFHAGTLDASWTADVVPWPAEENHDPYSSTWVPVSPANVWNSTAQQQAPSIVPTPTPSDDASPNTPRLASPALPEELKEEHSVSPEQAQNTPAQSRAPSPDQFGTFESANPDVTIPVAEDGWGSPKYSTFDDSVDSSNAWGQQAMAKELDTAAEPVDEWEAARRTKEKLDRRVVCAVPRPFNFDVS